MIKRSMTEVSARVAGPSERQTLGFSLIEMLVALVILSLSLGVLYQAAAGATRNLRVSAEYLEGTMLAESLLAEHITIPEEGFAEAGHFADFDWNISSWPAESDVELEELTLPLEEYPLHFLQVQVSWGEVEKRRSIELLTVAPLRIVE